MTREYEIQQGLRLYKSSDLGNIKSRPYRAGIYPWDVGVSEVLPDEGQEVVRRSVFVQPQYLAKEKPKRTFAVEGPETRIIAIADRPGGVESAYIVD